MVEHRRTPRIEENADVSVKIQSAPQAHDLEGRVFPFQSEDISLYGLKLDVDIPVPIGALLELEVILHTISTKYRHMGSVVWANSVRSEQEGWHEMGVKLHVQSNPQFDSWAVAISNLGNKPN